MRLIYIPSRKLLVDLDSIKTARLIPESYPSDGKLVDELVIYIGRENYERISGPDARMLWDLLIRESKPLGEGFDAREPDREYVKCGSCGWKYHPSLLQVGLCPCCDSGISR